MFRTKKNPADEGRTRLPTESSMRDLLGLKELVVKAGERRGTTIELPWTTGKPSQVYILTVLWDKSKDDPVWTLYDEIDGKSTPVWSEPFPPNNVELVYDILVMSTGATTAKAALPENLKAGQVSQTNSGSHSPGGLAGKFPPKNPPASGNQNVATSDIKAEPTHAGEPSPAPTQQPAHQSAVTQPLPPSPPAQPPAPFATPQIPVPPPGYTYPTGPATASYQGQPAFPQTVPPQPYPMAPGYPPVQQPPYMFPQQPMAQPIANAPGFLFPQQPVPLSYPPGLVQQPTGWANSSQTMPIDAALLDKHADILLGELLTRADLITEPTLAAALKIMDLVQEGKLSSDRAPEILKTFFSLGGAIEDYIDSADLISPSSQAKGKRETKKSTAQEPEGLPDALTLLIKSGVLAENDLKMASDVQNKHGGVLSDILQAAGKLDKNTFDAALSCASLEKDGLLKLEQCIIALNYCMRSRVTLDEALEELNWENPRKKDNAGHSSS